MEILHDGFARAIHRIDTRKSAASMAVISFRPLLRCDLPMLHDWLGRPHVSEWWGSPSSLREVEADYLPMIEPGSTTRGYIALLDGQAFGFMQSYVVVGSGDGWWENETDPGARGIDQFIANVEQLDQGLGSDMIRAFIDDLFRDPAVSKVQTDPSPENHRAIRCYERAGFVADAEVDTPDGPALLMVRNR
jgi:RimJ/RimL family protein N-acetyltransferase